MGGPAPGLCHEVACAQSTPILGGGSIGWIPCNVPTFLSRSSGPLAGHSGPTLLHDGVMHKLRDCYCVGVMKVLSPVALSTMKY
jgi:hypothetical protein